MSAQLVQWAKSKTLANKNQRNALICLAGMADDDGRINAAVNLLIGIEGITTRQQAERALTGLLNSGLVKRNWNFDTYTWTYCLQVA